MAAHAPRAAAAASGRLSWSPTPARRWRRLGSWWLIGAAALEGRFDPGTLLAWSFLLLSLVPLGLFAMWSQGVFMLGVSGILKLQLLAGALKLDPDETRHQGIGQHLARVIESESLEGLALAGGFYALAGVFDLLLAAAVLVATSRAAQSALLLLRHRGASRRSLPSTSAAASAGPRRGCG